MRTKRVSLPDPQMLMAWIFAIIAGASCYYASFAIANAWALRDLPAHYFQGGQGMALSAPSLMYGICSLILAALPALYLIAHFFSKERKTYRAPHCLALLLLLPAGLIFLKPISTVFVLIFRLITQS